MEEQKKQNLLTAVIIILVIALAIMITSIVYEEKVNMSKKPVQNVSAPVIEDDKTDADKNGDSSSVQENENKQPTEKEDKNNNSTQTGEVGEEENKTPENTEKSKEEKAIELVKKQWGNDDSVTFSIEQKNGTKYYVAVKSETKPTMWYEVDTESWKVSEY